MTTYRVSSVEAFRKWEGDEDAELEPFLTELRDGFEASPAMIAGTAFHKALELAVSGIEVESVEALGHCFRFVGDFDLCLTPIRELRASKTYIVDGKPIVISGQVDALDGVRIEDHKTTSRFDPDRYLEGAQWRLYLDIFGAKHFRWNVFEIAEVDSAQPSDGFELPPAEYEVRAQHRLEQFAYPGMSDDCQRLVERFARFVRQHLEVDRDEALKARILERSPAIAAAMP